LRCNADQTRILVTIPSLKRLLSQALKQRLQDFLLQELGLERADSCEDDVILSLRQERRDNGIAYVSALPQKLAAGLSANPVNCLMDGLQQSPLTERHPLSARSVQDWIWVCTTVERRTTGHLRLALSFQAVVIWLHHWINWSELSSLANPLSRESSIYLPSRVDGVRLGSGMSPRLLMQYLYARCHQIRQLKGSRDSQPAEGFCDRWGENQDILGLADIKWDQHDSRVIHSLVQLVDSLALPATSPQALGKLVLQLALAADTWLGNLPATLTLSPERQLIARGTEEALRISLQLSLGVHPQKSL
jgi:hypothetical protein